MYGAEDCSRRGRVVPRAKKDERGGDASRSGVLSRRSGGIDEPELEKGRAPASARLLQPRGRVVVEGLPLLGAVGELVRGVVESALARLIERGVEQVGVLLRHLGLGVGRAHLLLCRRAPLEHFGEPRLRARHQRRCGHVHAVLVLDLPLRARDARLVASSDVHAERLAVLPWEVV
eukprot:3108864-Pleurochrysis_carterae.AAC.5